MAQTWIEVQPVGYLSKFGKHSFYVENPAEALRFMIFQVPGFKEAFESSKKKGLKFELVVNGRSVRDLAELHMGKPKTIKVIPRYEGRKSSAGGFLFIAAAIAATILTAGTAGFAIAGSTGWLAAGSVSLSIATSLALSFALGGISQLLTPQADGLSTTSDAENKASYAFGGPVNTTAQGNPIPAFYGEREVGGAVISASILAEDQQ